MDKLLEGYRRFRAKGWPRHEELYHQLGHGPQTPLACVISCCDSRVDPVSIFDADPGLLFVVRNVANLVPPFKPGAGLQGTSTAIEFAVRQLKVGVIIVLGHARCGGIMAAVDGTAGGDSIFLGNWISLVETAKSRVGESDDLATAVEHESIKVSLERLMEFPFVAAAVQAGQLKLVGARFSIFDGRLELLDQDSGKFQYFE
ncbi:MAG: carbonic anhydrase [Alphaproteobacteria bacterium]|nr:carbonic anhydrase [Alphaproteobacteria bacterium]